MNKLNLMECPEFDPADAEKTSEEILKWGCVKLDFNQTPITIGGKHKCEIEPYWTMYWDQGFMTTPFFIWKDLKYAKIHAAAFIYLWCKGIPTSTADHLCHAYSISYKKFKERDNL